MYYKYNTYFQHYPNLWNLQTCHINIGYDNVGSFYHDLICNTLDARSSQNEHPLSFILCKQFLQIFFESHPVLDQTQSSGAVFSWFYRKL
jgi:hypothetical protein